MKKDRKQKDETVSLRFKAEEQLKKQYAAKKASVSGSVETRPTEADILKLLHELEVYQIELEMQNEELRRIRDIATHSAVEYAKLYEEIYDFSPSGYFTLSSEGLICELNLSGARMLGMERDNMVNENFRQFVFKDSLPAFNDFLRETTENNTRQSCTLKLNIPGKAVSFARLEGIVTEAKQKCLVTLMDFTEQQINEEALRESEFFFRESQRAAFIGSYKTDFTTGFWESSEVLDQIFGIDKSYNRSVRGWLDITHPDDRDMMDRYLRDEVISKRRPFNKEYRIIRKSDGDIRWVHGRGEVEFNKVGTVVSLIGTIQDITDRKQADEKLKESEAQFRNFFENAADAIFIAEIDSKIIIDANQAASRLMQLPHEKIVGLHQLQLHPPSHSRQSEDSFLRHEQETKHSFSTPVEDTVLCPDGSEVPVEVLASMVTIKGKSCLIGTFRDITERKLMEDRIRESENYYRTLLDTLPDAIVIADAGGHIQFASQRAFELFGVSSDQVVTQSSIFTWLSDENREAARSRFTSMLSGENYPFPSEYKTLKKDGSTTSIEIHGSCMLDAAKQVTGLMMVCRDISARKLGEEALRKSEERYRNLVELSPTGIAIYQEGQFVYVNPAAISIIGAENPKELIGKPVLSIVHPESRREVIKRMSLVATGISVPAMEEKLIRLDGSIFDAEVVALSTTYNDKPAGQVLVRDITENKRAEEALKESQLKYQIVADNTYDWEFWQAPDGKYLYHSPSCKRITGYEADVFLTVPKKFLSIIHPEDLDIYIRHHHIAETESKRTNLEFRIIAADGSTRWIGHLCQPIYDAGGSFLGTRGSNRDITDRKQAEEHLKESEERWRKIIDTSPDGIAISTFDGRILTVSPAAVLMWGYDSRAELTNHAIFEFIDQSYHAKAIKLIDLMLSGTYTGPAEYLMVKKDQSRFYAEANAEIIRDAGGEPKSILFVLRDITERKQAEEEINKLNEELEKRVFERTKQLEAVNQELEAFSYSVSHDLRTPLRALDGFANILLQDYSPFLDTEGKRLLGIIIGNANKMGYLIDDLLSFSRLNRREIKFDKIDMYSMVNSVYQEIVPESEREKISFHLQNIPETYGDPAMIRQVWLNLIGNAVKYSSKKSNRIIEVGNATEGSKTIYFVKDNGAGFDMAHSVKLFGVFQRLHTTKDFEGTGIGLAIVQRIVTRHQGRVWAEGKVNEGATFYFILDGKEES